MIWAVGWRARSAPEAECVYIMEQSREEELWHTTARRQSYYIQINEDTELTVYN